MNIEFSATETEIIRRLAAIEGATADEFATKLLIRGQQQIDRRTSTIRASKSTNKDQTEMFFRKFRCITIKKT